VKTDFIKKELGLLALLIVLCIAVAAKNPRFLSPENLQNTTRLIGMYGIFSLGLGFVIITGGIDLSVGSILALLGVILSIALMDWHMPAALGILLVVALGAVLGSIHGWLIARVRLQPFIVTLCGLLLYRGLARFVAKDETRGFSSVPGIESLTTLATGNILGIPIPFVFLLALAAVAAVFIAFYTSSISPSSHGNSYELYGIAAAVLGGCSLRGGEGSIVGILIGTALLQVLQNLVNLLGIDTSLNFAVMGAVILIGVAADQVFSRRRDRRK
jgi:ribose transport system permease protein